MANWYGHARTNYVKFQDVESVKKLVEPFQVTVDQHTTNEEFYCLGTASEFGGFDFNTLDEEGHDVYLTHEEIGLHLQEGQVLVFMEVGAEKLRYLTGSAVAVNWKGQATAVTICDIYEQASREFGVAQNTIADCTYQNLPEEPQ